MVLCPRERVFLPSLVGTMKLRGKEQMRVDEIVCKKLSESTSVAFRSRELNNQLFILPGELTGFTNFYFFSCIYATRE